jgi:hypothetical protein
MKCCNHSLTTPFCPYCGTAAPDEGLPRLLLHLKSTVTTLTEKRKNTQETDPENTAKLESQQKSIDKWLLWHDQLQDLMAKSAEGNWPELQAAPQDEAALQEAEA